MMTTAKSERRLAVTSFPLGRAHASRSLSDASTRGRETLCAQKNQGGAAQACTMLV